MSTNELGQVAARAFASEYRDFNYVWSDGEIRRWHDVAAAVLAVDAVRRIFRAGDPEPDDVRAVLDRDGGLWAHDDEGYGWFPAAASMPIPTPWDHLRNRGPLVEVVLPKPVTQ